MALGVRSHRVRRLRDELLCGGALCGSQLFTPLSSWASLVAPSPLCDEDVSVLRTAAGKQIVIVGTAHVSEESAQLVREVIQQVEPDTVMVELDKPRAISLMRKARARKNGAMVAAAPTAEPQSRGQAMYQ